MLHRNDQHHCTFSIIMSCKLALVKNIKMLLMYFGQKVRRLTGTSRLKQEPEYAAFCSFYFIEHFVWRSLVILLPATWLFYLYLLDHWRIQENWSLFTWLDFVVVTGVNSVVGIKSALYCTVEDTDIVFVQNTFWKKRILRL